MGMENLAEQVSKAAEERLSLAIQELQDLQFSPERVPVASSQIVQKECPYRVRHVITW